MNCHGIKVRAWLLAASLASLAVGFRAMLSSHLPGVFNAPEEDLAFAWFVPLFSLYVLWTERGALVRSLGAPSWGGLLASVPFLFLGLLGARGLQVRFELVAFTGLLVAIPWAFFGRKTAARVLFPAAFLLFCMPLNSYLSLVTVHLRLLVSAVSAGLLSGFGMDIAREGNMIALPGVVAGGEAFVIDIANPCSGLRSIFALLALAAGYGYFTQPTWTRRAILFALAVPCAVVGNILRIVSICVVAKTCDPGFALGFYHDFAGYVVFLVALALMVGAGAAMDALLPARKAAEGGAAPRGGEGGVAAPRRAVAAVPVATAVLVVAAMAFQARTPRPVVAAAPDASLPEWLEVSVPREVVRRFGPSIGFRLPAGTARFEGDAVEPSVAETNVLVGAVLSKRAYAPAAWRAETARLAADGAFVGALADALTKAAASAGRAEPVTAEEASGWLADGAVLFRVATVTSGPDKQSLHRPELCLPSQGFDMADARTLRAGGVSWRVITLAAKGGRGDELFAYTFFNQDGYRTDSHVARICRDTWDRTFLNRVDRWVMVSVQLHLPDEGVLEAVLSALGEVVK